MNEEEHENTATQEADKLAVHLNDIINDWDFDADADDRHKSYFIHKSATIFTAVEALFTLCLFNIVDKKENYLKTLDHLYRNLVRRGEFHYKVKEEKK